MAKKVCLKCKSNKNIKEFGADSSKEDNLCIYCKACKKILNHKWCKENQAKTIECCNTWRQNNLEYARKKSRERNRKNYVKKT